MSKSTKPGSAAVRAARAGAFTTNFLSPAPLKCECASREPSSTSGRAVAALDVSDSLSCQTAARNRSAALSRVPVTSSAPVITNDWSGYISLAKRGYKHLAVAEEYLPIIHLVFCNLKTWPSGIHHGVSHQHLQAYLNEFTFRFNRRF